MHSYKMLLTLLFNVKAFESSISQGNCIYGLHSRDRHRNPAVSSLSNMNEIPVSDQDKTPQDRHKWSTRLLSWDVAGGARTVIYRVLHGFIWLWCRHPPCSVRDWPPPAWAGGCAVGVALQKGRADDADHFRQRWEVSLIAQTCCK